MHRIQVPPNSAKQLPQAQPANMQHWRDKGRKPNRRHLAGVDGEHHSTLEMATITVLCQSHHCHQQGCAGHIHIQTRHYVSSCMTCLFTEVTHQKKKVATAFTETAVHAVSLFLLDLFSCFLLLLSSPISSFPCCAISRLLHPGQLSGFWWKEIQTCVPQCGGSVEC